MAQSHDPRREVEKLRENLGFYDKPLAFLIGAGASCAARDADDKPMVPTIAELGCRCVAAVKALGENQEGAYTAIVGQLEAKLGREPTVEDILSSVRAKIAVMAEGDILSGADSDQMVEIEAEIRKTIATAAMPDPARVTSPLPHQAVGRWLRRIDRKVAVEIFTTNYDTLLERGFEDERVSVFDGFVGSRRPFFSSASLTHPSWPQPAAGPGSGRFTARSTGAGIARPRAARESCAARRTPTGADLSLGPQVRRVAQAALRGHS